MTSNRRQGEEGRRDDDTSPDEIDATHENDFPFFTTQDLVTEERRRSLDRRAPTKGMHVETLPLEEPILPDAETGRGD